MNTKTYNEDVIEWAKRYDGEKFHALLCDPPYHLVSIVKRFGKKDSAPARFGTDGVFSRSSKGFMGQVWDGGDVAFRPETWEAIGEHLYPGAFGMAFSASRNWHRLAVAIEDAGFVIHPSIFGWLNGQGFPKATNIHKRLDGEGKTWEGHRYGLQALKPALEPIIVFQKPYSGSPIANITGTGAGALNIDGARIPLTDGDEYTINTFDDGAKSWGNGAGHKYTSRMVLSNHSRSAKSARSKGIYGDSSEQETHQTPGQLIGRYPANFVLSESVWDAPESRFFFQVQDQIDESDPIFYTAKVGPKERNAGLDDLPEIQRSYMNTHNGNPVEGETWHPIDDRTGKERDRFQSKSRNPHPTLKPIALAKYLATLLLPPIEYAPRRIFIPFSGVASEMIGAGLAGWEEIVGVEFDKENGYVGIAKKRLAHWLNGCACEIINP